MPLCLYQRKKIPNTGPISQLHGHRLYVARVLVVSTQLRLERRAS